MRFIIPVLLTLIFAPGILRGESAALTRILERVLCSNAKISLPVSAQAPVIDGAILPNEWDNAIVLNGFSTTGAKGTLLGAKNGKVYIKRTRDHLYLAIKTITLNDSPGGGLLNKTTKNDSPDIANDDTIELTFFNQQNPDQIKQLIFNPGGFCLDICRTLSTKRQDKSWNIAGMQTASKVESFYWILETAIPLAQIAAANGSFRFNAARNWCDTGTFSTVNRVTKYFMPAEMIEVVPSSENITVRQNELGNPDDGNFDVEVQLDNNGKKDVIFGLMLHEYTFKKVNGKVVRSHKVHALKSTEVKAQQKHTLRITHTDTSQRTLWLATAILDAGSKQFLFRRLVQGKKSLSLGRRPVFAAGEIKNAGSFIAYDYPGFNHAAFTFKFRKNIYKQLVMTSPDGKKTTFPIEKRANGFYCRADIPSLPGNYSFDLPDGKHVCRIPRKKFAFLNNPYGKEKVVIPPFTKIGTEKNTVKMLFREHTLNAFGLWDSVTSKGTQLLAQPMYFELVSNGKKTVWKNTPVSLQVNNDGHDVSYSSATENSSGVKLHIKGNAEYDGFFFNSYTLENPRNIPIDRLTLCIPLVNAEAPLFHVISNTIRTNPAGFLPQGEGELWNGGKLVRQLHFGQPVMHNQFVPLVWLGGIEKGVCYFMDNTFGCKLSNTRPQVRIIRSKDVLMLEADIINEKSTSSRHAFEFGLQATPVKPVPRELLPYTRDGRGWNTGLPNLGDFNQVRGGFPSQWASMPMGKDYSLYKKVIDIISGKPNAAIGSDIREFFKKHKTALKKDFDKEYPGRAEIIIKSAESCTSLTDPRRGKSLPIMYTDPRLVHRYEEASEYFKSEWWNPARINYTAAWRVSLVPSLQDYLVYQYRKLLQCSLRGINLDDAYLMPDNNPETVAKVDEYGVLHADAGILQLRSYIKRLATMMHTEFKIYPRYIEPHMTNGLIIPAFAFADGQLGMEQHYGEKPRTECFGEGEILATYTGRQIGAKPLALPGLKRMTMPLAQWKKVFPRLTRSNIALTVPFGITARTSIRVKYEHFDVETYQKFYRDLAAFGITDKDCVFVPCFENTQITVSDKNIRIGYYQKQGAILACVANAGKTESKVTLPIQKPMLDWESRKPVSDTFTLAPGDFRLIYISK